jgi:hypothetical protein
VNVKVPGQRTYTPPQPRLFVGELGAAKNESLEEVIRREIWHGPTQARILPAVRKLLKEHNYDLSAIRSSLLKNKNDWPNSRMDIDELIRIFNKPDLYVKHPQSGGRPKTWTTAIEPRKIALKNLRPEAKPAVQAEPMEQDATRTVIEPRKVAIPEWRKGKAEAFRNEYDRRLADVQGGTIDYDTEEQTKSLLELVERGLNAQGKSLSDYKGINLKNLKK